MDDEEKKKRELEEQLLALEQEQLNRRKDDPLFDFKPHDKQQPFVDAVIERGVRNVWLFGANRSGKSDIGAYVGSHLARFGPAKPKALPHEGASIQVRDRATSGWVVSLDFPSSRDIVQPKYFNNGHVAPGAHPPFIPEREIKEWRAQDQVLKLKNGSLIGYKSCDSGASKFQGTGKDWVHFDEEPPKSVYDETVIRVEAGRSLTIFGTCTLLPPIGKPGGVSWMFEEIIKPFQKGLAPGTEIFTASIYDNPFIGKDELAYLEAMFPEDSPMRRIRLNGELIPGIGGARVYTNYRPDIHVKDLGEMDRYRPICWLWDFNISPLITLIGQRFGEGDHMVFKVYKELVMEEGNIPDMCEAFYEKIHGHGGEIWIYGDATGTGRNTQSGQSDYTVIMNSLRRYSLSIRKKVKESNPLVSERVNAMQLAFLDETGTSHIEVDVSCKELINDFEQVLSDPLGGIKKSRNPKEPYYRRTHSSDAMGYWVSYERPVRSHASLSQRVIQTIQDISYAFRQDK